MSHAIFDKEVKDTISKLSMKFDSQVKETVIILAAGHGKRIKSQTSKMLHKIWEVPTVERVYNACTSGLNKTNTIVIVGIKALDVMDAIGKRDNTLFAFQEKQKGTGHAVQVGIGYITDPEYDGIMYVLPGDMGLIDAKTMDEFKESFKTSENEMMVLTGLFKGDPKENSYGRIVRVKKKDILNHESGNDLGKVIEIIEQKDILCLNENEPYILEFGGRKYSYSKEELLMNNEYNSGVFAFKFQYLKELIYSLESNNAQNEIYITDLISVFNDRGLSVGAVSPGEQHVLMGFNNKSVLRQMDSVARELVYNRIKDIVEISDPDDFFIHEQVVDQIIQMDLKGIPLDIKIGKGVSIGKGVKLNYNLLLEKNARVQCHVEFGKNVHIHEGVELSCYPGQQMIIGNNVEILRDNIVAGNVKIGDNCRIESGVKMTGSDEYPLRMGKNLLIKGTSYIFGSVIEDDIFIEHSVLIKKKVERLVRKNGKPQSVRFYLPMPEGIDTVEDL